MINDEWAGQFCGELNNDDLGLPIQKKKKKNWWPGFVANMCYMESNLKPPLCLPKPFAARVSWICNIMVVNQYVW